MNDQRFYSLVDLMEATNKACDISAPGRDLICYEARQSINNDGNRDYSVFIKNASQDDLDLQNLIMKILHDQGFHGVEVVTEW